MKEEIVEDEGANSLARGRQVRLKMIKDDNEFGGRSRRTKSTELRTRQLIVTANNIGNVSEEEEENKSESSSEGNRRSKVTKSKTYSIGYLTKTIFANKIYSDDFDIDKA